MNAWWSTVSQLVQNGSRRIVCAFVPRASTFEAQLAIGDYPTNGFDRLMFIPGFSKRSGEKLYQLKTIIEE
ncbi:unnamed protein product [Linum tenue]|uniref:Uncharacterized protein n=1 Tax=Linum tenue TaxID=586396 RepID=A0AAV0IEZ2_9ROSI|nr:unnamed protein product [Linum tenue]